MQLKKLELQGFKSFADKTEIVFLDGVTTIVGPNGSGKSNISDALRWVLGEQSVKNLRGGKMEDVIFAGTQARKKVGFAEVSMYLDNTDSTLPVEYKEVVVTRRIYRTGESNYLINGNECRLKDITELFMDTGIGKDGYSIISQGKIDEILSTKSEERRNIFEEASGIVKYRTRKEEASKKLENTEITLARVRDILNEIENTIGPLEKKAEIAKKYLALRDELKVFDVRLFISIVEENANNLEKLDDMIRTFEGDIEKELKISEEYSNEKEALKQRAQEISSKIEQTQNNFYEIQTEAEKLNSKIDVQKNTILNNKQNILRMNDEINEDNKKIDLLRQDIEKRLEKRKSMFESKKKFDEELLKKQEKLNEIMLTLDKKDVEISKVKKEIDLANDRKYDLKVDISSLGATIEANEKQINDISENNKKNVFQKDSLNMQKEEICVSLGDSKKNLATLDEKIGALITKKQAITSNVFSIKEEHSKLSQEVMTLTSKLNYLKNLENENEGYVKSVKEALEYSKNNSNVYGTLASLISTDEKYEYALEIALGGYMQNIVVNSESEAKDIIAYLKEKEYGRATFLPLNGIKEVRFDLNRKVTKYTGYIGLASELVKYDSKFAKVINLSLGQTLIVDSIENALALAKDFKNTLRIVTLSGELIAPTGSITGGKSVKKGVGLIGRKEKIENLEIDIEKLKKEFNEISEKLASGNNEIENLENELSLQKSEREEINIQIATITQKLENVNKNIEKIELQKEESSKSLKNLVEETNTIKSKISSYNDEISKIDEENSKNQVVVDEYNRFNKEKSQEMDFLNEDILNLKISLSSFDESVASIDEMKEKIEQDIKNFEFSIDRKNEQIELSSSNIRVCEAEIENLNSKIESQENLKENFQDVIKKLKNEKDEIDVKQEKIDKSIVVSSNNINKLKEEKSKVEARKVKFDIELENTKNKMWDDYELTISSAKAFMEKITFEELPQDKIVKKAEAIKKQIKDLGEVNVSSIDEYNETKKRYDFITNQKNDLEETKDKLNNLINNMTSIMKSQFSKQFKLITENFNETFNELFGGGRADLRLSDESNVLESGIEIEVQPPGKKLQSMMLLSGGERALTATALLFAILKLKSPPFCILDEIEAALDDVNVHRFARYIEKYSKNTQFIVITHRKGTMEVASSTYGVTMQEYGVSKVISMKMK